MYSLAGLMNFIDRDVYLPVKPTRLRPFEPEVKRQAVGTLYDNYQPVRSPGVLSIHVRYCPIRKMKLSATSAYQLCVNSEPSLGAERDVGRKSPD